MVHAEPKERLLWPIRIGLAGVWIGIVVLLAVEYGRVREQARDNLLQRARDISDTIALISRSGRIGMIREDRLKATLDELVRGELLRSVMLVNALGETVVAAGEPGASPPQLPHSGVRWEPDRVIVTNVVDLGADEASDSRPRNPTIVIPESKDDERIRPPRPEDAPTSPTTEAPPPGDGGWDRKRHPFGRPPWISESEFRDLIERRGVHGFVLTLNTAGMNRELNRDLRMRTLLAFVALLAVGGIGVAVSSWSRFNRLLLRLVRSQQQNEHLKEMNLAAAGLAHETRNPLNLIRGLAQTMAQQEDTSPETRDRSRQIVEELDRVTYRLNEFIRYSKPPQPRLAPVDPSAVAENVRDALAADLEERHAAIRFEGGPATVEADEMLLRQLLFNLLLNAVQAVGEEGEIVVTTKQQADRTLTLSVEDNGPGVPAELRDEIFRPYMTTNAAGSGLGLAVVRQICAAHDWRIVCTESALGGACFTVSAMRPGGKASPAS
ncbi:MAG: two-component system, NtrC family, sensor histidine kinase HydH [Candidatus Sumerlaeota bacterium]|nr:two-component system, NtrC family, sensor histidine kinase HydH [Candidatus Sumerlaeota bacterium]